MFERHCNPTALRGCLVVSCLMLLAGCLPDTYRVAPVPVNVTAAGGDRAVNLAWGASLGAAAYNVKRSTTVGGPYSQLAMVTATTYMDSAVTNGASYYYVVSSLAPDGESPDSLQVSGFPDVVNPPPSNFGVWTNVTPTGVDLTTALCSNFGATSVQADPAHPSNLYTMFHCQGIWKSTNYGLTWTGPINTGTNGATAADCSGGITIAPGSTASVPTIYAACIRGGAVGFWRSLDGGVNWTHYLVGPSTARQDYQAVVVDPYDTNHLLMTGHEFDGIVESADGGQTWASVAVPNQSAQSTRTGFVFFINTGDAVTTRGTWLWLGDQSGGFVGTWRTTNAGTNWLQVDKNEHLLGAAQIYQAGNGKVVYMAGAYSTLGNGVLRSNDYGQTWAHVGLGRIENIVFGTSKNVYAMFGAPVGPGAVTDPALEVGAQPGSGIWVPPGTPATLTQGAAQVTVVNDGASNIAIGAMWNAGLWRYVEP